MNKFYVYAYVDPRKFGDYQYDISESPIKIDESTLIFEYQPFYIGKGKNNRCYIGLKSDENQIFKLKYNKIQSMIESGNPPIVIKLYENLTEEEALQMEVYLIGRIGKIINKTGTLVNITDGGDGGNGFKHSDEWRKVLSKPVIQLDIDGSVIEEFNSIKEASIKTLIHKQNIGACVNGKYKTAGGYKWKYKNEKDILQGHLTKKFKMPKHTKKTKNKLKKTRSQETISKLRLVKAIPVIQYDINGNFIKEWYSSAEVERELGIYTSGISRCCNGKLGTFRGFIWRLKLSNEIKLSIDISNIRLRKRPILQYSLEGDLIKEWVSMKEADLFYSLPKGSIQRSCSKSKKCAGFIWKYKSTSHQNIKHN